MGTVLALIVSFDSTLSLCLAHRKQGPTRPSFHSLVRLLADDRIFTTGV